jgi:hypothetical protein
VSGTDPRSAGDALKLGAAGRGWESRVTADVTLIKLRLIAIKTKNQRLDKRKYKSEKRKKR